MMFLRYKMMFLRYKNDVYYTRKKTVLPHKTSFTWIPRLARQAMARLGSVASVASLASQANQASQASLAYPPYPGYPSLVSLFLLVSHPMPLFMSYTVYPIYDINSPL